ncbi:MAG: DM13 domain-containing protein [Hyphomonadaceae bacterium]
MKLTRTLAATALLAIATVAACSQSAPAPAPEPAAAPAATASTASAPTVASANFSGRSDHVVLGNASIVGTAGNYELVFAADFDLDGAPDPVVGFGNNGTYDEATKIGALSQQKGAQRYSLPADFDPANAGEVYVWCEQFSVPLGVASFAKPTVASADFSGRSDHVVLGNASIVGTAGNYELVFAADFDLDGAPDPVVGFGNNGTYDEATKIGALSQQKGAQRYSLPADFDPANAGEVYVWCEQFSVPLGVATF